MRNRYGGICYQCGEYVEAGAGHFERFCGGWRVHHVSCTLLRRDPNMSEEKAKAIERKGMYEKAKANSTGTREDN
jgi:hypothetical protein